MSGSPARRMAQGEPVVMSTVYKSRDGGWPPRLLLTFSNGSERHAQRQLRHARSSADHAGGGAHGGCCAAAQRGSDLPEVGAALRRRGIREVRVVEKVEEIRRERESHALADQREGLQRCQVVVGDS